MRSIFVAALIGLSFPAFAQTPEVNEAMTLMNASSETMQMLSADMKGDGAAKQTHYAAAKAAYQTLLATNPNHVRANQGLGELENANQEGTGNSYITKAIALSDAAIQANPKDDVAYYNRGVSYSSLGQLDKAEADIKQSITLNPGSASQREHRLKTIAMKRSLQGM